MKRDNPKTHGVITNLITPSDQFLDEQGKQIGILIGIAIAVAFMLLKA